MQLRDKDIPDTEKRITALIEWIKGKNTKFSNNGNKM